MGSVLWFAFWVLAVIVVIRAYRKLTEDGLPLAGYTQGADGKWYPQESLRITEEPAITRLEKARAEIARLAAVVVPIQRIGGDTSYAYLGVDRDCSQHELDEAYQSKLKLWDPQIASLVPEENQEGMREILEARSKEVHEAYASITREGRSSKEPAPSLMETPQTILENMIAESERIGWGQAGIEGESNDIHYFYLGLEKGCSQHELDEACLAKLAIWNLDNINILPEEGREKMREICLERILEINEAYIALKGSANIKM